MILRLLNNQGLAGLAASVALATLLVLQMGETLHWKKQSAGFEQLYRQSDAALTGTVANYRAAAGAARAADQANAARVAAGQRAINERTAHDFEARVADARVRSDRLRIEGARAAADPGAGGNPHLPGLSAASGGAAQDSSQGRLPAQDALIATEQAIQLDELIKWIRAQAKVDNNRAGVPFSATN